MPRKSLHGGKRRLSLMISGELAAVLDRIQAITGAPVTAEPSRILEAALPELTRVAEQYEAIASRRHAAPVEASSDAADQDESAADDAAGEQSQ